MITHGLKLSKWSPLMKNQDRFETIKYIHQDGSVLSPNTKSL